MRSGLSAAANYAEARAAESRADFIHKLRIVLWPVFSRQNGDAYRGKPGTLLEGTVQSETSDFGFEVQDLSNFRFFRALDESSILMPCSGRARREAPGEGRDRKSVVKG